MTAALKWYAAAAGNSVAPYEVTNSLIFTRASSQYVLRTMSTATDSNKWTFSAWLRLSSTGILQQLFISGVDVDDYDYIQISSTGQIRCFHGIGGGNNGFVYTGNVLTSTTPWYHMVVAYDSSESSANKIKIYLDGSLQSITVDTAWQGTYINRPYAHSIGVRYRPPSGYDNYFNGKMADINFIDGQALTPSDFGETAGTWTYKKYTGTYGNNGFHLDFKDGTSTTTLGYDVSGNSNNFTLYNMTTANQSTDVPA